MENGGGCGYRDDGCGYSGGDGIPGGTAGEEGGGNCGEHGVGVDNRGTSLSCEQNNHGEGWRSLAHAMQNMLNHGMRELILIHIQSHTCNIIMQRHCLLDS